MKKYAEYKNSGIEWIGMIPKEWSISKVKYVFKVVNGATPKSTEDTYWDGDIIWVTPSDYKTEDVIISSSRRSITLEGLNSCGTTLVPQGSIIISNRAPIGTVGLATKELCTNQGCKSLVKVINIEEKYYYYIFSIMNNPLNMLGRGTTFLELSSNDLSDFNIPFPNIEVQQAIVDYLDQRTSTVDALIADKQKLVDLLQEKRQAIISEAVSKGLNTTIKMKDSGIEWIGKIPEHWKIKKIAYVATAHNGDRGTNYPSGNDLVDDGVPFITTSELYEGKIVLDKVSYITEEKYIQLGGLKIQKYDIIYCLRGSVGKNGIADFDRGTIASSLMGIRCHSINPYYLVYLLNSSIEEQQRNYLTTGSVSANLSAENVMRFKFAIPPYNEQEEIVMMLNSKTYKIDTIIDDITTQINKLKEYRKSIISEAVTGKVEI